MADDREKAKGMKSRRVRRGAIRLCALAVVSLALGEVVCRAKVALAHHDPAVLMMPLRRPRHPQSYRIDVTYRVARSDGEVISIRDASAIDPHREEILYWKMQPGAYTPDEPWSYGRYHVNSLGFRGPEFDPTAKAPGTTRVFCLGESSTFGMESPDDATWPARLGDYLNRRADATRVEVINGGMSGYTSRHLLNLVEREVLDEHPDVLVFYMGFNDVGIPAHRPTTRAARFAERAHRVFFYNWSMLYTVLVEKAGVLRQGMPFAARADRERNARQFLEHVRRLIALATARKVEVVFVRQMVFAPPSIFLAEDASPEAIRRALKETPRDPWGLPYGFSGGIERHNELMASLTALCRQQTIPMLDVRPAFHRALLHRERLFTDIIHLTPAGNDLLARSVAEGLPHE